VTKLGPIGGEMRRLEDDSAYLDSILREGAQRARNLARPVMDQVKDILGLIR
jgi:tryptophanyl-tRNA synthetase